MAKKPISDYEGKEYYTTDLDPLGIPYPDAVPLGSDSTATETLLPCPGHWPFIPAVGSVITLVMPALFGSLSKELVKVVSVNLINQEINFSYSGTSNHSILKAGVIRLNSVNWNSGFIFE